MKEEYEQVTPTRRRSRRYSGEMLGVKYPETPEQRRKRNKRACKQRKNLTNHFTDLMSALGVEDQRHKTCPPRHELLTMAINRIIELRKNINDIQNCGRTM